MPKLEMEELGSLLENGSKYLYKIVNKNADKSSRKRNLKKTKNVLVTFRNVLCKRKMWPTS